VATCDLAGALARRRDSGDGTTTGRGGESAAATSAAAARAREAVAAAFIEAQGSLQLGTNAKDRRRRCRVQLGHERAWLLLLGSVEPWRLGRWAGAGRAFGLGPVGKDMIFLFPNLFLMRKQFQYRLEIV
jgi:hypothetical protein